MILWKHLTAGNTDVISIMNIWTRECLSTPKNKYCGNKKNSFLYISEFKSIYNHFPYMKILETTSFTKWLYTCGHTNSPKKKRKKGQNNILKLAAQTVIKSQVTSSNSLDFY